MIEGKSVLAVIPARGGSKGVPRKNIREVGGKPLIAWTIEEAKKSQYVDRLILSSDDAEIIRIGKEWGCEVPFVRPAALAQDQTPGIEPVLHAVREVPGFDYVVLLQPTSPHRTAEDIDNCLEKCLSLGAPACVSVTLPDKSPYWMYTMGDKDRLCPLLPSELITNRQNLPKVYALNGAIYVAKIPFILDEKNFIHADTAAFIMPKERSLDVDDEIDLDFFDFMVKRGKF